MHTKCNIYKKKVISSNLRTKFCELIYLYNVKKSFFRDKNYLLDFKLNSDLLYVKALGNFNAGFPNNVTVGFGGIGSYPICNIIK